MKNLCNQPNLRWGRHRWKHCTLSRYL